MTDEELREGFEAWLGSKFISTDGGLNEWTGQFEYAYPHVQSMWVAWQAAIAYIRQHDGHAEFVRAVWSLLNKATHELNTSKEVEADNAIWDGIRLCDDELAKEQNNG